MNDYDEDCDHDFEILTCNVCGLYQGTACVHCGAYSDGGDFLASRANWCDCGEADHSDEEE